MIHLAQVNKRSDDPERARFFTSLDWSIRTSIDISEDNRVDVLCDYYEGSASIEDPGSAKFHTFSTSRLEKKVQFSRYSPVSGIFRKDSFSFHHFFRKRVEEFLQNLEPDLVIVHDRPQFIPSLSRALPDSLLVLFLHDSSIVDMPHEFGAMVYENIDGLLVSTQSIIEDISVSHRKFPPITKVIEQGVDTTLFRPPENSAEKKQGRTMAGIPPDSDVIAFATSHVDDRTIDSLAAVMGLIRRRRENAVLVVIPSSPAIYKSFSERLIHRAPALRDCSGVMKVTSEFDLSRLLMMSDVLVQPTTDGPIDFFDVKVGLDAMSCGLPVIWNKDYCLGEFLANAKSGFQVAPDKEPEEIAEKTLLLLEKPGLASFISGDNRRIIENRFSWNRISDKLLAYCQEMTGFK